MRRYRRHNRPEKGVDPRTIQIRPRSSETPSTVMSAIPADEKAAVQKKPAIGGDRCPLDHAFRIVDFSCKKHPKDNQQKIHLEHSRLRDDMTNKLAASSLQTSMFLARR